MIIVRFDEMYLREGTPLRGCPVRAPLPGGRRTDRGTWG
jgi:hypothetical protein